MEKTIHKTNHLKRFLLVVGVLVAYAGYSVYSFGLKDGLSVTLLTWTFFVFGTPIADAGFLLAFPVRLITGLRMWYTQVAVWIVAMIIVPIYIFTASGVFSKTPLLQLFYKMLTTPWPLWLIFLLSAGGTYVTVKFDDEVYDVATAKDKGAKLKSDRRKMYIMIGLFAVTLALYVLLLYITHIHIKWL